MDTTEQQNIPNHNKVEGLGGGIISISIISIILSFINIVVLKNLTEELDFSKFDTSIYSTSTEDIIIPSEGVMNFIIICSALFMLGSILILCKKTIGLIIYFISIIPIIIVDLFTSGITRSVIIYCLLFGLMIKFMKDKSHLFTKLIK